MQELELDFKTCYNVVVKCTKYVMNILKYVRTIQSHPPQTVPPFSASLPPIPPTISSPKKMLMEKLTFYFVIT